MDVIIVFGLPGSGKSYFAEKLARELDAVYISSDQIRDKVNARNNYSFSGKMEIYDKMQSAAEEALRNHSTVVLDGTFYLRSIREKVHRRFKALGAHLLFMEIKADKFVIKERLKQKRRFSDADYQVHVKLSKSFERMCEPHFVIHSNDENIEEMLRLGLRYVQAASGCGMLEVHC